MKTIAGVGCLVVVWGGSSTGPAPPMKCKHMKDYYKNEDCCGNPEKDTGLQVVPGPQRLSSAFTRVNPCQGKNPNFKDEECFDDDGDVTAGLPPQAGADVSNSNDGGMYIGVTPQFSQYWKSDMCPVNVHWHLGAEHRSAGQYDERGSSPEKAGKPMTGDKDRYGFACHKYNPADSKFNTPYEWKHCVNMHVGETYEVHWPHSALGHCHTQWQYQYPFYDGVFCNYNGGALPDQTVASGVGVQAQVFTIVNDENYYYPNLMWGMIKDGEYGRQIAIYTGSTTGTKRNNTVCSKYGPITWQVDRNCHLISASSFDKMCAEMKQQRDDMSNDLFPHGARQVVLPKLTADNMQHRQPNP